MRTRSTRARAACLGGLLLGLAGCMSRDGLYPALYESLQTRQRLLDGSTARAVADLSPTYADYEAERKRSARDTLSE